MEEGDIFRNIRKALKMSQAEFCALFNRGPSWITKLERGHNDGFKQFVEVASILVKDYNVCPRYLITGDGPIFCEEAIQPSSNVADKEQDSDLLGRLKRLEEVIFGKAKLTNEGE